MSAPVISDTVRANLIALMGELTRIHNDRTDWSRRYRSDWYLKSAFYERDLAWLPAVLGTVLGTVEP